MLNQFLLCETFIFNFGIAKLSELFCSLRVNKVEKKSFLGLKFLFKLSLFDHSILDYPQFFKKRFLSYYSLLSYVDIKKYFFFFKSNTNTTSMQEVYPSSEWLERESYDFFGVFFANHPDLRRILTDYGFPSFPLRKDFPVQGYFDLIFSIINKKIQMKEIEFQQSYRVFGKENPYLKEA